MKKLTSALILSTLPLMASAESWYAGAAYSSLSSELSSNGITLESDPNAINLVAGYEINENFAVEGLLGTGLSDDAVEGSNFDFELKSIVGISAVGALPVGDNAKLYAKLGWAQVDYDDSDGDASDANGAIYGIGASFGVAKNIDLNVEYVVYPDGEYEDFDIDVESNAASFGVIFKF